MGAKISKRGSYDFTKRRKRGKDLENRSNSIISLTKEEIYEDLKVSNHSSKSTPRVRFEDEIINEGVPKPVINQVIEDSSSTNLNSEETISLNNCSNDNRSSWKNILNDEFWTERSKYRIEETYEAIKLNSVKALDESEITETGEAENIKVIDLPIDATEVKLSQDRQNIQVTLSDSISKPKKETESDDDQEIFYDALESPDLDSGNLLKSVIDVYAKYQRPEGNSHRVQVRHEEHDDKFPSKNHEDDFHVISAQEECVNTSSSYIEIVQNEKPLLAHDAVDYSNDDSTIYKHTNKPDALRTDNSEEKAFSRGEEEAETLNNLNKPSNEEENFVTKQVLGRENTTDNLVKQTAVVNFERELDASQLENIGPKNYATYEISVEEDNIRSPKFESEEPELDVPKTKVPNKIHFSEEIYCDNGETENELKWKTKGKIELQKWQPETSIHAVSSISQKDTTDCTTMMEMKTELIVDIVPKSISALATENTQVFAREEDLNTITSNKIEFVKDTLIPNTEEEANKTVYSMTPQTLILNHSSIILEEDKYESPKTYLLDENDGAKTNLPWKAIEDHTFEESLVLQPSNNLKAEYLQTVPITQVENILLIEKGEEPDGVFYDGLVEDIPTDKKNVESNISSRNIIKTSFQRFLQSSLSSTSEIDDLSPYQNSLINIPTAKFSYFEDDVIRKEGEENLSGIIAPTPNYISQLDLDQDEEHNSEFIKVQFQNEERKDDRTGNGYMIISSPKDLSGLRHEFGAAFTTSHESLNAQVGICEVASLLSAGASEVSINRMKIELPSPVPPVDDSISTVFMETKELKTSDCEDYDAPLPALPGNAFTLEDAVKTEIRPLPPLLPIDIFNSGDFMKIEELRPRHTEINLSPPSLPTNTFKFEVSTATDILSLADIPSSEVFTDTREAKEFSTRNMDDNYAEINLTPPSLPVDVSKSKILLETKGLETKNMFPIPLGDGDVSRPEVCTKTGYPDHDSVETKLTVDVSELEIAAEEEIETETKLSPCLYPVDISRAEVFTANKKKVSRTDPNGAEFKFTFEASKSEMVAEKELEIEIKPPTSLDVSRPELFAKTMEVREFSARYVDDNRDEIKLNPPPFPVDVHKTEVLVGTKEFETESKPYLLSYPPDIAERKMLSQRKEFLTKYADDDHAKIDLTQPSLPMDISKSETFVETKEHKSKIGLSGLSYPADNFRPEIFSKTREFRTRYTDDDLPVEDSKSEVSMKAKELYPANVCKPEFFMETKDNLHNTATSGIGIFERITQSKPLITESEVSKKEALDHENYQLKFKENSWKLHNNNSAFALHNKQLTDISYEETESVETDEDLQQLIDELDEEEPIGLSNLTKSAKKTHILPKSIYRVPSLIATPEGMAEEQIKVWENQEDLEIEAVISEINDIMQTLSNLEVQIGNLNPNDREMRGSLYQELIKVMREVNNVNNLNFNAKILEMQHCALKSVNDCLKQLQSRS